MWYNRTILVAHNMFVCMYARLHKARFVIYGVFLLHCLRFCFVSIYPDQYRFACREYCLYRQYMSISAKNVGACDVIDKQCLINDCNRSYSSKVDDVIDSKDDVCMDRSDYDTGLIEMTDDVFYSANTLSELRQLISNLKNGRNMVIMNSDDQITNKATDTNIFILSIEPDDDDDNNGDDEDDEEEC